MSCRDKTEYVVHFKLLKFYLMVGMRITKIHRVIKFRQTCLFKKYIDDTVKEGKLQPMTLLRTCINS